MLNGAKVTKELLNALDSAKKPQTNADRIRAMSDEELAEFICSRCHFQDIDNTMCGAIISCDGNCLKWLKQPAEGERQ